MHEPTTHHQMQPAAVTVVLVEDHALVREQLVDVLGHAGIDVLAAVDTVRAGYDAVLARRPDVAVLDSHLPDGRGVDLCRRLTDRVPGLPVVMHSGAMTPADTLEAFDAGAVAVIPKTVRADALIQAVRVNARMPRV
jgi:two-component system response regulator DevR